MVRNRDKFRQEEFFRIMQILHKKPEASAWEIANELGVSNGSGCCRLLYLKEKAYVEFTKFTRASSKILFRCETSPKNLASKTPITNKF